MYQGSLCQCFDPALPVIEPTLRVIDPTLSVIDPTSRVAVDVCGEGTEELVADAEAALGSVYMLVNCAGYSTPARFEDLTMQQVKVIGGRIFQCCSLAHLRLGQSGYWLNC